MSQHDKLYIEKFQPKERVIPASKTLLLVRGSDIRPKPDPVTGYDLSEDKIVVDKKR